MASDPVAGSTVTKHESTNGSLTIRKKGATRGTHRGAGRPQTRSRGTEREGGIGNTEPTQGLAGQGKGGQEISGIGSTHRGGDEEVGKDAIPKKWIAVVRFIRTPSSGIEDELRGDSGGRSDE